MDVTAAKQAEEALHEAQAELAHVTRVTTLGELAASIAHEVNQPLAAIVTNGELACAGSTASRRTWTRRAAPWSDDQGRQRASEVIQRLRALVQEDRSGEDFARHQRSDQRGDPLVQQEVFSHRVSLRLDWRRRCRRCSATACSCSR